MDQKNVSFWSSDLPASCYELESPGKDCCSCTTMPSLFGLLCVHDAAASMYLVLFSHISPARRRFEETQAIAYGVCYLPWSRQKSLPTCRAVLCRACSRSKWVRRCCIMGHRDPRHENKRGWDGKSATSTQNLNFSQPLIWVCTMM